jgi:integrase
VLWRDADTGRQTSMQFPDKTDAENFRRIIEANNGSLTAAERFLEHTAVDGPTLAPLVNTHIDHVTGATEYTVKRYRDYLRLHIAPSPIGGTKVKALLGNDLRRWIVWMEDRGKSPKTIANVFGLLSSTLIGASRDGIIPTNPCAGVRLPKRDTAGDDGEMTREDFQAIRDRIDPHFQPFLDLLLGAGLRFSEATALEAADFKLDADTPTVRVSKAWKQGKGGGWHIGPPKTAKGKRTVSLAPSTVASVRPVVEAAPKGLPVFRMKRGGTMTPQAFYNRAWAVARAEAGLADKVTVHSIRHLHAAVMLRGGLDMYELSRRMGHESVQMTVDLYSHLLPDAHFRAAEAARRALES